MATVSLTKPLTEGGDNVRHSVDTRFGAGLPFSVPKSWNSKASRDASKMLPMTCSRAFHGIFPGAPERFLETATAFVSFPKEERREKRWAWAKKL